MLNRPIRVLMSKIGLDGHDRGAKVVALSLKNAGMEVIYTGLRHTAEEVVETAIQEDVDVLGVSTLSGAHMTIFTDIMSLFKEKNIHDIIVIGGGIIPDDDQKKIAELGIDKIFTPGTDTHDIIKYINDTVPTKKSF